MSHVLEIDSIRKSFDNTIVLSDVYLKCKTGDIIGILGRNGAGKSTLLKIIFGLLNAENKFIRINNKIRKTAYKHKCEIIYLPQDNFVPHKFKVSKAIKLFIDRNRQPEFENDELIRNIYSKKINQLSGGELRYLEIFLCLCNNSKFTLLDEPYNGLSPILIKKVNALIIKFSKEKGIILTDHYYKHVLDVSSQLYIMKDCAMKKLKNKDELIRHGYLKDGML